MALTSSASISMKLNLGNFQTVDLFFAVSGIDASTTREEIDALLEGPTRQAYESVREHLKARGMEIRKAKAAAAAPGGES